MDRLAAFVTAAAVASLVPSANAGTYEINVTRKGSNVYRVDGKSIIIQTRYCYVYGYSEESLLKTNGYGGDLIFISSKDKCEVKAVYAKSDPAPGKYSVRLTQESDDWYQLNYGDTYVQTSLCLSLALGQEAFLTLNVGGYGRVIFDDGQSCTVEAVYSKMKLQ
jgi:hypothetical protein